MARVLFTTFGSYGDLHPYLAIACELRHRGHTPTIATSATYRERVEQNGILFHAVRPDIQVADQALARSFFDRKKGSERVVRFISSFARESYEDTFPAVEATDLLVTQIMALAAVAAGQKAGKPWISTVLAPSSLLSAEDPPVLPPAPWLVHLRAFGPGLMRKLYEVGKRQSRAWLPEIVALRTSIGLSSSDHPFFEGANSPHRMLGLFSKLLMPAAPDWPSQLVVTGFPFLQEDQTASQPIGDFLSSGPPPIVFTLGSSAVHAAGEFYRTGLAAAMRLGQRALLLTGDHRQGLPEVLPPGAMAVEYVPHSDVFPKAALIVHQGGIGTTAQAMRAGKPMLVVPFSHDQPDNGWRVQRLGMGRVLPRERFTERRAVQIIRTLLENPEYAVKAARIGESVQAENGTRAAADEIERSLPA